MPFANASNYTGSIQSGFREMDGGDILKILSGQINFSALSLTGLLAESATDSITAHAGGGQTSATLLTTEANRITTVATAGDSVMLPASVAGLTILIDNAGANPMQVYGAGTDTINGVATATGVSQMAGSEVIYVCHTAGAWFANGLGNGYAGSLSTQSYNPTAYVAHAGGGQASATALQYMQNVVGTVATTGDSVVLPTPVPGLQIAVLNTGANNCNVFCPSGGTMNGTSNGSAAVTNTVPGIFFAISATAWLSK